MSREVFSGFLWSAWGKGARTVLQFVVLIVLARLMTPHEFGVVGAATIVIGFAEIFTHIGLGPAIVQRTELRPEHVRTAFSASIVMSVLIAILIWVLAPKIAHFFNYEGIESVLRTLILLFPIKGLGLVPESLAQRGLKFKQLANAETASFAVGYFVVGVPLALLDFGVWALVAANLVAATLVTTILFVKFPVRGLMPTRKAFGELIYFGGGYTIARIANYIALQVDYVVVGRAMGLTALGLYGRAYQLMSVPASAFGQVLDAVLFPSMAKIQDEKERLAAIYLRGVSLIAMVMMPASAGAFLLAPEIVEVLLGPEWGDVVLPFQILVLGLLARTSYKLSDSLTRARGAVYSRALRQIVYGAFVFGGAYIGRRWGVEGVACGVLLAVTLNFLLMAEMSLKILGVKWSSFATAHSTAFVYSVGTAAFTYLSATALRSLDLSPLVLLLLIGTALLGIAAAAFKIAPTGLLGDEARWAVQFLRSYGRSSFTPESGLGASGTTG